MPTFGKTSIGATKNNFPGTGGGVSGSIFTLAEYGAIESASVYFQGDHANHAGGVGRVLIYSVKGNGEPGGLVATSEEVAVVDGVIGWLTFPFASPIVLPPADYCLCIFADAQLIGGMDVAGTNYFRAQTYASGAPDPFGSPTSSTNQKSIYVTYAQVPSRLRVVTWNVAGSSNSTAIAAFLKSFAPLADIIALQEVNTSQAGQYETALEAAYGRALNCTHAPDCDNYSGGVCTLNRTDGQFLATPWTIGAEESILLPYNDDFDIEARSLIRYTLTIDGRTVNFFNLHGPSGVTDTTLRNKVMWAQAVNAYALPFAGECVLLGDFNAHAQPPTHKASGESYLRIALYWKDSWKLVGTGTGSTRTANSDRIDLIMYSAGLIPIRSVVGASGALSDHYPVYTEFAFAFPVPKPAPPITVYRRQGFQ